MRLLFAALVFFTTTSIYAQCCPYCSCSDNTHTECHCTTECHCHPLCTCNHAAEALEKKNYGVQTDKISHHESITVNGQPVQQSPMPTIPEDSGKLHLTIIGSEAERKAVLHDLDAAPELAEFRDRFLVQDYPPDHWAVRLCGFHTAGHPTIYLQTPSGAVLHRQDDYNGPKPMAEAIRRATSDYSAGKDPDLRTSLAFLYQVPTPAWLLLAGFAVPALFTRKGQ